MAATGASESSKDTEAATRTLRPPSSGRRGIFSSRGSAIKKNWPIWLVAGTTFLSGALSILQMLFARLEEHSRLFTYVLPFGLHYWGRSLTVVLGFMLIYLSLNLFQRRRVAWWLAVVASALLVAAHILSGRLWYLAIAPALAFVLLLIFGRRFTVRSEPSSIRRGVRLMAASLFVALAYGTLGFWYLGQTGLRHRVQPGRIRYQNATANHSHWQQRPSGPHAPGQLVFGITERPGSRCRNLCRLQLVPSYRLQAPSAATGACYGHSSTAATWPFTL